VVKTRLINTWNN